MKTLPVPVKKFEQKRVRFSNAMLIKVAAIAIMSVAIAWLLFFGLYLASLCFVLVALTSILAYNFYLDVTSLNFTEDNFGVSLEHIIEDLEHR